ncbi:MAG: hypothetical protein V5B33_19930 [Candidatus Accumulibacter sp. UW20]|jgi:hypothetical protein
MSARKYANGTWPRFKLGRPSSTRCQVRAKRRIEQRQGFAARFYAIGTWPKRNLAKALPSLQAIDYKHVLELGNLAPLKGDRDSGQVPEISSPSRVSGEGKNPSFSGTKRGKS